MEPADVEVLHAGRPGDRNFRIANDDVPRQADQPKLEVPIQLAALGEVKLGVDLVQHGVDLAEIIYPTPRPSMTLFANNGDPNRTRPGARGELRHLDAPLR